jgi:hypothetical protein
VVAVVEDVLLDVDVEADAVVDVVVDGLLDVDVDADVVDVVVVVDGLLDVDVDADVVVVVDLDEVPAEPVDEPEVVAAEDSADAVSTQE